MVKKITEIIFAGILAALISGCASSRPIIPYESKLREIENRPYLRPRNFLLPEEIKIGDQVIKLKKSKRYACTEKAEDYYNFLIKECGIPSIMVNGIAGEPHRWVEAYVKDSDGNFSWRVYDPTFTKEKDGYELSYYYSKKSPLKVPAQFYDKDFDEWVDAGKEDSELKGYRKTLESYFKAGWLNK